MKSRNTSVYYGEVGDGYFQNTTNNLVTPCSQISELDLMSAYETYKLTRYKIYPLSNCGTYIGQEVFDSTTRKKPLMNNCYHSKIRAVNLPFALYTRVYYDPNRWLRYNYYRLPYPNVSFSEDVQHLITEHSGPSRRAWWNMQPRFEGEVQMLNFLFELKDFKDLAKYILRPNASLKKLNKLLKSKPPRSMFDPTKPAAAGFLTWNLAIAPFIRDLASIHAQLATLVREVQQEFLSLGSEVQSSHYSETLEEESSLTPYAGNNYWWSTGTHQETRFTATMHYQYAYEMRSTIDAFVKYWGLSLTAEAFWNMIPFSFIWDYFQGIAKSLHAMRVDKNVTLNVHEYAESLFTRFDKGYFVMPDERICCMVIDEDFLDGPYTYTKLLSGISGTLYERRVTEPDKGPALPKFKTPKQKQWMTMAAIVRCML